MKQVFLSIGLVASAAFAYANPVSVQTAQAAGANFMSSKGAGKNVTLQLAKSYASANANAQTAVYVFDVNNGNGFVIVSGDDAVRPILGYSTENVFPAQVNNNEVAYWMNGYTVQISNIIFNKKIATPEVSAQWNALAQTQSNGGNTANKPTDVSPMIFTLWDQMNPYTGTGNTLYNNLCPTNAPTGCVATAMAQIMNFWQKPAVGTSTHSYNSSLGGTLTANFGATTYDWANMPNTLTNSSSAIQKNAIALLMSHCGISVNMHYDLPSNGGSGAYVISSDAANCSEKALKTYFGYKSTIKGYKRSDFSDTQWIKMLEFELDNGRPLLYTGFGAAGGHAFDFDGYDNNDFFHINWGWSGQSNGYFVVDDLSPSVLGTGGGGGNFNNGQQALVMIEPANSTLPPNPFGPDYPTANTASLVLNATVVQSEDTITYNAPFSVNGNIKNQGTSSFNSGYLLLVAQNVANSNSMFLLDQRTVTIAPSAIYNYNFSSTGETDLVVGRYVMGYIYSTDGVNTDMVGDGGGVNNFYLTVKKASATGISNAILNSNDLVAYPNPANDYVSLDWKGFNGKVTGMQLFNILGQEVYHNEVLNGTNIKIQVSNLSAGTYSLRIVTDMGTATKKIIIK